MWSVKWSAGCLVGGKRRLGGAPRRVLRAGIAPLAALSGLMRGAIIAFIALRIKPESAPPPGFPAKKKPVLVSRDGLFILFWDAECQAA